MPHLPPAHNETSKHVSPNEIKIKEKQNKIVSDSNSNLAKSMTHHNQTKELTIWFLNISTIVWWHWVSIDAIAPGNAVEYQPGLDAEACASQRQKSPCTPQLHRYSTLAHFSPSRVSFIHREVTFLFHFLIFIDCDGWWPEVVRPWIFIIWDTFA
jgi:hypothetical protein